MALPPRDRRARPAPPTSRNTDERVRRASASHARSAQLADRDAAKRPTISWFVLAPAAGLIPATTAYTLGSSSTEVAMVGAAGASATLVALMMAWCWVARRLLGPIDRTIDFVNEMARGRAAKLEDGGAPMVRLLARSLNAANLMLDERNRRSQANLLSAEVAFDRIHSVLQSVTEGVIVIDLEGNVVLANRAGRALLQDGGQPVEGRSLVSLFDERLGGRVAKALQQVSRRGSDRVQLMGIEVGDRIYDISVVPVQSNRPDHDFGTVVVVVDVTRNVEIARLKDRFLSSISHELRTPLTNICAFSEILAQVSPNSEGDWREFVQIVGHESQRLKALVDDVLDYSRMETGQVEWNVELVEVAELTRGVVESFREAAARREIELNLVVDGDATFVMADRDRLRQVVAKLLDNAVKFTPERGRVRVRVLGSEEGVEVGVGDSGPGVPAQDRETVFDKFSQIGDTMTEKPSGTGLGLPICRRVIDHLGGAIWCEESDLGGAEFRFVLPPAVATGGSRGREPSRSTEPSGSREPAEPAEPP